MYNISFYTWNIFYEKKFDQNNATKKKSSFTVCVDLKWFKCIVRNCQHFTKNALTMDTNVKCMAVRISISKFIVTLFVFLQAICNFF